MALTITPPPAPVALVEGGGSFTVGRVFCVGRNYAAHAAEMGGPATPIFFTKPASAVIPTGATAPYPAHTQRMDHEIELVLALGAGGRPENDDDARALIAGYAAGVDLTRRDAQAAAKAAGEPWDAAKGFDASAPLGVIRSASAIGHPRAGRIWFEVDGAMKQDADIAQMTLSPEALLIALGAIWELRPGDLVFTGTPEGVGPMTGGQEGRGGIDGVGEVSVTIV